MGVDGPIGILQRTAGEGECKEGLNALIEKLSALAPTTGRLMDHVGLPWHDACLEPHKNKRSVLTASKTQVIKPVYKTSVESWKPYEKHLQPLIRIVAPELAL